MRTLICATCYKPFDVPNYRADKATVCSRKCAGIATSDRMKGNAFAAGKPSWNSGTVGVMRPNAASFKAGSAPWNKGTKGATGANSGSFAAGHERNKTEPIGAVNTRTDKQGSPRAWVKVAAPNKWRPRAQVEWEKAHGPIPTGMLVHHDNRDTLDDAIGNLVLISRADHIREHRRESEPKRLANMPRGDNHPARIHPERLARGERHGCAKLNDAAVRAIRGRSTETARALAAEYGVKVGTVKAIRAGRTWRHVT